MSIMFYPTDDNKQWICDYYVITNRQFGDRLRDIEPMPPEIELYLIADEDGNEIYVDDAELNKITQYIQSNL